MGLGLGGSPPCWAVLAGCGTCLPVRQSSQARFGEGVTEKTCILGVQACPQECGLGQAESMLRPSSLFMNQIKFSPQGPWAERGRSDRGAGH